MPDIEVGYSSYFIRRGVDPKLGVVYRIIRIVRGLNRNGNVPDPT